ncbi:hypothetical protein Tdes44962_MAKER03347 [Teratosphaeria destructans]|uniref:Uncharacterized protein n=1 Tax=Teratosphaeria destructans TaxID=418781 RepID=A0A9W7SQH6_9PEZI|nr:hypothetical protein Tdes44962_MAKER03347 [Teratosphaeria destructans]
MTKPDDTLVKNKQPPDTQQFYFEFHYTDEFVNVGDLWLWDAIWQRGFNDGDRAGLETDKTYKVHGAISRCVSHWASDDVPDLEVNLKLSGQWGTINGISGSDVRNQIISSLWDLVVKIQDEHDTLFKDCRPCGVAKDGCFPHGNAACGLGSPDGLCVCEVGGKKTNNMCMDHVKLMRIPSAMELRLYNMDGSLRADGIRVMSHSEYLPPPGSGYRSCGKLGAVAEVLLNFLPVFGKQFGDTVKVLCRGEFGNWDR